MKRVLTVQDISCVGKCSLTVALPIISAFGVETAVLPTAVLSTHTAFKGFTFRDLTEDLTAICKHWKEEKIEFDAIYTGYLGSAEQLNIVSDIFRDFRNSHSFYIVDPVMADNGKLYAGFDIAFAKNMAKLCAKADVIVPNLTEASFLLGEPYAGEDYTEEYIRNLLVKLSDLGAEKAVLTGISFDKNLLGVYAYDSNSKEYFSYYREKLPCSFHGTGDVFASALCGAMATGNNLENSLKIAVDYTVESIKVTLENPSHNWYGVDFENAFPYLMDRIEK